MQRDEPPMNCRTILVSFTACLAVGTGAAIGDAVGQTAMATAATGVASFDLASLLERGGTIAALAWMVVYFQRALAAKERAFKELSDRVLMRMDTNTAALNDAADALRRSRDPR